MLLPTSQQLQQSRAGTLLTVLLGRVKLLLTVHVTPHRLGRTRQAMLQRRVLSGRGRLQQVLLRARPLVQRLWPMLLALPPCRGGMQLLIWLAGQRMLPRTQPVQQLTQLGRGGRQQRGQLAALLRLLVMGQPGLLTWQVMLPAALLTWRSALAVAR
jgi:hypothetical protein